MPMCPSDPLPDSVRLGELYRESRRRPSTPPCLPSEILEALATAEISKEEREWAVDHLAICSDCAEEYRLVRDLAASAELRPQKGRAAPAHRWLAWAATLVLAFGAGHFLARDGGWPGEGEMATRGAATDLSQLDPAPDSLLKEAPKALSWERGPEDSVFEVAIYGSEGSLVWRSQPLTQARCLIPEPIRQEMSSGTYHWQVFSRHGVVRTASHLSSIHIESGPE